MSKIMKNGGFNWGSRSIIAVAEATGTRFEVKFGKGQRQQVTYFADGYKFTPKQFGEHMLKQANEWMIENGLVDLKKIANFNLRGYKMFTIN